MTNEQLEKKYYPIYWIINNDEIEITDRNNNPIWGLNSPHIKYHKNREDYKKYINLKEILLKIKYEMNYNLVEKFVVYD